MGVFFGSNIDCNRVAFVVAGAKLLLCGLHSLEDMALDISRKTLHATTTCPTTASIIATGY
jgi:hypothetical protein